MVLGKIESVWIVLGGYDRVLSQDRKSPDYKYVPRVIIIKRANFNTFVTTLFGASPTLDQSGKSRVSAMLP
jgi:hypothetical protein